jgi:alpha-galactosidase
MGVKVGFIGAGSIGFTRRLMADILTVPELADTVFSFTDISKRNLDMITQLAKRDIKGNKLPAKVLATTVRKRALEDCDYVINVSRIGGLEAFQHDIEIPLKYGVDQCVGDTLCAGGIMYGQRNIPQIMDFCADIEEVAKPGAFFLNYANPMAMNTWAASHYTSVPTIGLCHGVEGGHWQITVALDHMINQGKKEGDPGWKPVNRKTVDIVCAGINHQTWYIQVLFEGRDWTDRLLEAFESHPELSVREKVRIDVLRHFGYYSTESNGHLSEYLPWYRKRPAEIKNWIEMGHWIRGETGGYLRVCSEGRNWFETDFPNWIKEEVKPFTPESRSHEHGSYIIEALETGRVYRGHFNVVNNGAIANLPDDCIVELPAYVDRNGVAVPQVGELPMGCAAICSNSVNVQRLSVEAALTGDILLLRQAMMLDPLVGAVCDTREVCQMVDEMLVAQAEWLPQYRHEIPKAKKRLAEGPRVKTREGYRGAARLKVKSVQEMAKEKEKTRVMAQAADKGDLLERKLKKAPKAKK